MCVCLCTFLSVNDDRTCVYMSDWSMTAWVLTGRFWAALPRLGPDSIAYERQTQTLFRKHETGLMKAEMVLSWRHSPQCSSARPPGILYTPGWVCRTQWPQQEDSPSLRPPGLRTRRTAQLHFTFTSLNVCLYILPAGVTASSFTLCCFRMFSGHV